MSLLMSALQRAEKTRNENGPRRGADLALEPFAVADFTPQERAQYDPAQAATLLTAGERQSALFDFARDHSFGLVLGLLLLAGVGWGVYVWLHIQSPGLFVPKNAPILAAPPLQNEAVAAGPIDRPMTLPASIQGAPVPVAAAATPKELVHVVAEEAPASSANQPPNPLVPAVIESPRKAKPAQPTRAPPATPVPRVEQEIQISREPESAVQESMVIKAYYAFQNNQYEAAKSLYQEARRENPKEPDALLGLAAIAAVEGNAGEASRLYFKVLELDPKNPTAQAGIISIAGRADPANAEARLKSLIGKEPSPHLYSVLGSLHAEQAQWPQAQAAYFQAFHLASDSADDAFNLAIALEHINQPKAALTYYRKALELPSNRASFDRTAAQARIADLQSRAK